jgi:hypothetical protein
MNAQLRIYDNTVFGFEDREAMENMIREPKGAITSIRVGHQGRAVYGSDVDG